jgi:hypothetical protein
MDNFIRLHAPLIRVSMLFAACVLTVGTLTSCTNADVMQAATTATTATTTTTAQAVTSGGTSGGTSSVAPSGDPTTGVLPSYNDAYANWKNAGLQSVGGIPTRTTVCATVNPLGSGQDDFTNIQNAINNCAAGKVVQLGAGAFTVHLADLPIHISTGISLRGTGACSGSSSPYCQTSITVSDGLQPYQPNGPQCGTSTSSEASCPDGGPAVILVAPVAPD